MTTRTLVLLFFIHIVTTMEATTSDLQNLAKCFAAVQREYPQHEHILADVSIPIKKFLVSKGVTIVEPKCTKSNEHTHYSPYRKYVIAMWDISATGEGSDDNEAIGNAWSYYLAKLMAHLATE